MHRFIDYRKIFEQEEMPGGLISPEMLGITPQQAAPAQPATSGNMIDLQITDAEKANLLSPGKVFTKTAVLAKSDGTPIKDVKVDIVTANSDAEDTGYPSHSSDSEYSFMVMPAEMKTQLGALQAGGSAMLSNLNNTKGASIPVKVSIAAQETAQTGAAMGTGTADQGTLGVAANPKHEATMPTTIKSFDSFVSEAKWIGKIDMEKGALKKKLGKEKLSAKDIKAAETKLKKKDKDKEKPGLQLDKKDRKTQKQLVLAKNLMKASGAMHESREGRIQGAKNELLKLHKIVEEMINKTSKK